MKQFIIAKQGETVDLMVWRHYGRIWPGLVEAVLRDNPGIADIGPVLPTGTRLVMQDYQPPRRSRMTRIYD